jgi:hypothetical protein
MAQMGRVAHWQLTTGAVQQILGPGADWQLLAGRLEMATYRSDE